MTDDIERKVLVKGSTTSAEESGRIRLLENKLQNLLVELESERRQKENLETLLKARITEEESLSEFSEVEILRKENFELQRAVIERNDLQAQNNLLQLKLETLNSLATHESEKNFPKTTIEKEYASLWLAVGELNKLDADKDKELRQLLFDRDEALEQRDLVLTKFETLRVEYEELRNHVEQIDKHLYDSIKSDPEDLIEYSTVLAGAGGKPGHLTLKMLENFLTEDSSPSGGKEVEILKIIFLNCEQNIKNPSLDKQRRFRTRKC